MSRPKELKGLDEGGSCMCIDPIRLDASFGQNRGEEYDIRPSTCWSYEM
jgi:hypothetical protein